jgi:RNA recognition motif-containing protein
MTPNTEKFPVHSQLDDAFHKFGRIRKIWVARRPPGFAFVEFDDPRDAEDAVRALDGT